MHSCINSMHVVSSRHKGLVLSGTVSCPQNEGKMD